MTDVSVRKSGNASGEDADFYGTNSAILANSGANLTISCATISTGGTHANVVFSNGSGTLDAASSYEGAINSSGAAGTVDVILEDGATWTLTGDSYISSFDGDLDAVNLNGYSLMINGVSVG